MRIDAEKMIEELHEWAESDEGCAYFERERKRNEIKVNRFRHFEKYVETIDFDELMYRLILEHDEDWREKCREMGHEDHPNNKLGFIIDYLVHNLEPVIVPQLDCPFSNQIWFYKGYYFQMIWGQGVVTKIYNKEDMKELLCL